MAISQIRLPPKNQLAIQIKKYCCIIIQEKKEMSQVVIKVIGNYSYQTSKRLGEGVYGTVFQGLERETKEKVAIKKIDLATFNHDKYLQNAIFTEICLLKRFNHQNIVKFKDVLSSKNSLYIITEYCKNGDLKQLLKKKKQKFKQEEAFDVIKQIMHGFSQLIKQKIIHRDLKPANILINGQVYKIADFGFAKYVDNFGTQMLQSCVGSPIYMAPQILERLQYTTKCDVWSLGIIFYQMIFGCPPWKAKDQNELLRNIRTISIVHVLKRSGGGLSPKAHQFLKRSLAYSEQERIGWNELFEMFGIKGDCKEESKPGSKDKARQLISSERTDRTLERHRQKSQSNDTNLLNVEIKNKISQNSPPNQFHNHQSPSHISGGHIPVSQVMVSKTSINTAMNSLINNTGSINSKYDSDSTLTSIKKTDKFDGRYNEISKYHDQMEGIANNRRMLVLNHYYCVQLRSNYTYLKSVIGLNTQHTQSYLKLLYVLSILVKYRSTLLFSYTNTLPKVNKQAEELFKKIKLEHQSYQLIYGDINNLLESSGLQRKMKEELQTSIGRMEIISEEKSQKLQNLLMRLAHENAQFLSEQVRKRARNIKELGVVEILDYVLDVLSLALGKFKALKELLDDVKTDEEGLKEYVTRVIAKLDRLTSNI